MDFYGNHRCNVDLHPEEKIKKPVIEFLCICGGRDFQHIPNPIREVTVECQHCQKKYMVNIDRLVPYGT